MRPKITLLIVALSISSYVMHAQRNYFQCVNEKAVEYDINGMKYGHFFQLELKKGDQRDPDLPATYRKQAVHYQNLRDKEFDRCQSYPKCSENYTTPSFGSQQECEQYLAPIKASKQALERRISDLQKEIHALHDAHRYSEMLPLRKRQNMQQAELACLKKQIEACNCSLYQSGSETGGQYVDWELFGIGNYVSLSLGGYQISKGNETIGIEAGEGLQISGYLKNYHNYTSAYVTYSFSYILNGHYVQVDQSIDPTGQFSTYISPYYLNTGNNTLVVSLINESNQQLIDLNLGPFTIQVQEMETPDAGANGLAGSGWSIHATTSDGYGLEQDINSATSAGKTPVGIFIGNYGEAEVFYIDDNPLGMTAWNLEWYSGADNLQYGINNKLEQGYFPMGICFTDQGQLYVLYIMSELSATAWQLVESELDLGTVSYQVQPYINENYVPVGISVYAGKYYTLLAQLPDTQLANWTIEGYENNSYTLGQNINSKADAGLVPFGYLKEEGVVNILYIGF